MGEEEGRPTPQEIYAIQQAAQQRDAAIIQRRRGVEQMPTNQLIDTWLQAHPEQKPSRED